MAFSWVRDAAHIRVSALLVTGIVEKSGRSTDTSRVIACS
jgi:hypothetical protein